MENGKDFYLIQNLLRNNLYFAYNSNVRKISFILKNKRLDHNELDLTGIKITLPGQSQKSPVTYSLWRIPQTRIFAEYVNSALFRISVLTYFNYLLVTIQNFSGHKIEIDISPNTKKTYKELTDSFNSHVKLECLAHANNVFVPETNKKQGIDLGMFWQQIINHERSIHPLNQIKSHDLYFLTTIDDAWSAIPFIDNKGIIKQQSLKSISESKLIVLTEIFLSLGRYQALQDLFKHPRPYNRFADKIQSYVDASLSTQECTDIEIKNIEDLYFKYSAVSENVVEEYLQNVWNELSLPCRKIYLLKEINENPLKLVLFTVLILKSDLWWKKSAVHDLLNVMHAADEILYNLMKLLSEILLHPAAHYVNGKIRTINNCPAVNFYGFHNQDLMVRYSAGTDRSYSSYTLTNGVAVAINQAVQFEYLKNENKIILKPLLSEISKITSLELSISGSTIQIPLCWRDFRVTTNTLRLKFLFKKNRFQVSLKGAKSLTDCRINGNKYTFSEIQYQKIYLDVKKQQPQLSISFFDKKGRKYEVDDWPHNNTKSFAQINALNPFGLLYENVQYQKKGSKKNSQISLQPDSPPSVDLSKDFCIRLPKAEAIKFYPSLNKSLLNLLLHTDAEELQENLIVYANNDQDKIRVSFFIVLGFYPRIDAIDNLDKTSCKPGIIIDEQGETDNDTNTLYQEQILKNHGNKKVLRIKKDRFSDWLSETFRVL